MSISTALEFDGIDDIVLFNAAEKPEHAYIFHQPTDGTLGAELG